MAAKKSGLKSLFSKSNKDCCSIEIEEVKANEDSCCNTGEKNTEQQKEI